MKINKDYCDKLYDHYIELKGKTEPMENNPENIPFASDILEKARLRDELLKHLEFLPESQLKELLGDDHFMGYVMTELRRRRENMIGDLRCEECEKFMKKSGPYSHAKLEEENACKGACEVYYCCMDQNCNKFMENIKLLEK